MRYQSPPLTYSKPRPSTFTNTPRYTLCVLLYFENEIIEAIRKPKECEPPGPNKAVSIVSPFYSQDRSFFTTQLTSDSKAKKSRNNSHTKTKTRPLPSLHLKPLPNTEPIKGERCRNRTKKRLNVYNKERKETVNKKKSPLQRKIVEVTVESTSSLKEVHQNQNRERRRNLPEVEHLGIPLKRKMQVIHKIALSLPFNRNVEEGRLSVSSIARKLSKYAVLVVSKRISNRFNYTF